ncbi:MAG: hypothetical protein IPO15_16125 [Anaerolineae bacterium]|uniref:hypothetical protein n=1 Tax=Candidatus Amarolinea dominans TaxID=3140696 RepID=UPI003134852C|nr:hypothetical protein [Anaerolineae bacterium]
MSPAEYLVAVKESILGDSRIERFSVTRERVEIATPTCAPSSYLPIASQLEFSEYVQRTPDGRRRW